VQASVCMRLESL